MATVNLLLLLLLFFVILFYIERKWLLKRKLAITLHLNSKLSGKFQHVYTMGDDEDDELLLWYGWPTKGI